MDPHILEAALNSYLDSILPPETEPPADQIRQLQEKVTQLEHAVQSHAVIDQALGIMVAVGRISPAEAWDVLRETSMCSNIKMRHVAEMVVTWGRTGDLAGELRDELSRKLASRIRG